MLNFQSDKYICSLCNLQIDGMILVSGTNMAAMYYKTYKSPEGQPFHAQVGVGHVRQPDACHLSD